MGLLLTFLTILGATITIWAYLRNQAEVQQNKKYAVDIFDRAKLETRALRTRLEEYAEENDAWDNHFMQGFTFRDTVGTLRKSERNIFTEDNRTALTESLGSGVNFENLVTRISIHRENLSQIEMVFDQQFSSKKN